MLLKGLRVAQIGCGIAGDIAGAMLSRLGADVLPVRFAPCPDCGADCDVDDPWRIRYRANKQTPVQLEVDGSVEGLKKLAHDFDGALIDGMDAKGLAAWTAHARTANVVTVVFRTIGTIEDAAPCDGLGAEVISGVAGTMGDDESPTPFGFLFGEVNVAVRASGVLIDRLLSGSRYPLSPDDDWVETVSAADACIDAMDNPWQEYSLPGPVHRAPNSLTRDNYSRTGPQRVGLVPYGLFQSRDAWVAFVGASTTDLMAERLQRPDLLTDERFATIEGRVANRQFVVDLLQQWIGSYDSGDELVETLGERTVVAVSRSLQEIYESNYGILGFGNSTSPYRIKTWIGDGARESEV